MAVAVRRDVADEGNVERGLAAHNCRRVFGDLAVQDGAGLAEVADDRVAVARADAAAAADAFLRVDEGDASSLFVLPDRACAVSALLRALAASDAVGLLNLGMDARVHGLLAGPRSAAHADVLHRAADAGHLVALEVRERDDHVGVHERAPDVGLLDVLAVGKRDGHVVRALEPVCDEDVAAGREGGEAVLVRYCEVVERVLALADVERVGVREEWAAAALAHEVDERLNPVRAQIAHVAGLAEVELDGDELVGKVDLAESGGLEQASELLLEVLGVGAAEIG